MEPKKPKSSNLKPFKSGEDSRRNLKGRPKKLPEIDTLLIEVLSKKEKGRTLAEQILLKMAEKALSGNLVAADMLLTRAYGKGKFQVEVLTGPDAFLEAMKAASLRQQELETKVPQQITVNSAENIQINALNTPVQIQPSEPTMNSQPEDKLPEIEAKKVKTQAMKMEDEYLKKMSERQRRGESNNLNDLADLFF